MKKPNERREKNNRLFIFLSLFFFSSPKPTINGVPQGSVLSPSLFLLFISDLSTTNCQIHSYSDDSPLHYSASFNKGLFLLDLHHSRLEAAERLTSDLVSFHASKTQFLHLPARHSLPNSYPLFFDNTRLSPSPLIILGLSLTHYINRKLHLSSLTI